MLSRLINMFNKNSTTNSNEISLRPQKGSLTDTYIEKRRKIIS